jgi:O-antigen ligase
MSLLGKRYGGSSFSGIYVYLSVGVALLGILLVLRDFFKNAYLTLSEFVSCLILFLFILIGVFTGYYSSSMFGQFVLFCIPSAMVALYYARRNSVSSIVKWIDVWMLVLSASFFIKIPALVSNVMNQTAWYSQAMSYDAACAILLNLYMMVFGKQYVRFNFFNSSFYKTARWFLLLLQFVALILGGGRGAIVVVIVGVICLMPTLRKQIHQGFFVFFVAVLFLIVGFYFVYQKGDNSFTYVLDKNLTRSFSMLDDSKTMYERTSGRNYVYSNSIDAIVKSPFIGYGLFRYVEEIRPQPYPHNILLEWALQYGILFAIVCLFFVFVLIHKYNIGRKRNNQLAILTPMMVVSFVQLLFSGSYMQTPLFWFVILFLFNYKPSIQNNSYS